MVITRNSSNNSASRHLRIACSMAMFGALCAFPSRGHAQEDGLSVDEAVRLALAHNRLIQSAVLDVARADAEVKAGSTRRLPSISVLAEAGESLMTPYLSLDAGALGTTSGGPIPANYVKLYASQTPSAFVFGQVLEPLTSQYRLGLEMKALRVGREISSERLRGSEQEIVSQVRHRYSQIVLDESALKTTEADIRLYAELERVTKVSVAEKTAMPSDLLDIQGHLLHARFETSPGF